MENFELRKTRTVSDILNHTFKYIRAYYKSLLKVIAVYVLAPLMLGSIIFSIEMGSIFSAAFSPADNLDSIDEFGTGLAFFSGIGLILIANLLLYGIIYQHMFHVASGRIPESIAEFSDGMFGKLLRLILMSILLAVFFIIYSVFLVMLIEVSAITLIFTIPLLIFLIIRLLLFPVALFVDEEGGFMSLGRSWELTEGYFWNTFGVYLVVSIVFSILSYLLSSPLYIIGMIAGAGLGIEDSESLGTIMGVFYSFSMIFQIVFVAGQSIALGLYYFNLEERKEGHSLEKQIESLEQGLT
jgi:hypothetical protein